MGAVGKLMHESEDGYELGLRYHPVDNADRVED
jgi:hypothetical protein